MYDDLPGWINYPPWKLAISIKDKLSDADDWGLYTHGVEIELKKGQPNVPMAMDTILHEINHAIYQTSGLSKTSKEEQICAVFATGWTTVWLNNPQLVQWLCNATKGST